VGSSRVSVFEVAERHPCDGPPRAFALDSTPALMWTSSPEKGKPPRMLRTAGPMASGEPEAILVQRQRAVEPCGLILLEVLHEDG